MMSVFSFAKPYHELMKIMRPPSKRRCAAIRKTGPQAAERVRTRRNLHAGRHSTFRKLQRIARIEAGLRIERM